MEHPDSEFDHLNPEGAGKLTPVSCKQVLWVTSGHSWVLHREDYFRPWYCHMGGFPGGSDSKESAHNAGDPGLIPGLRRSPGEGNGYPFHILAWRISWTEEPGGLQLMGLQRVDMNEQPTLSLSLWVSLVAQMVKNLPAKKETWV